MRPAGSSLILRLRQATVSLLMLAVWLDGASRVASQQPQPPKSPAPALHGPPMASDYAGDAACARCHEPEAHAWSGNPHHLDSAEATQHTILGDFTPGKNIVRTKDPNLIFTLIHADDGFYQAAVDIANPQNLSGEAQRFDVVVGTGRRGQTSLYWHGNQLFELPISYWGYTHEWVNSPGYRDGQVRFQRPIIPRCLECHSTWFEAEDPPNHYVRTSMILGVGCEKCHGPGRLHVERESSTHPPAPHSPEEAIVNPAVLARARQMDVCALCHAGAGNSLQPALSFRPGDVLADYIAITAPLNIEPVDVHGNQVNALERSRCYLSSQMTCSTCHNVHEKQEDPDSYSVHCLQCHKMQACGRFREMGASIRTKCVECHMPERQSAILGSLSATDKMLRPTLREHQIAVYPKAVIDSSKALSSN